MIKISDIMLYLFMFFLVSTGLFFVVANFSVSNTKLDAQSQQDLERLNIQYYDNTDNPFSENQSLEYSLSDYSNTDEFAQSNIETKGALTSILDIVKNDNETSALKAPLIFASNMLPLPAESINWSFTMIAVFAGIVLFIAFIAAWKGGIF